MFSEGLARFPVRPTASWTFYSWETSPEDTLTPHVKDELLRHTVHVLIIILMIGFTARYGFFSSLIYSSTTVCKSVDSIFLFMSSVRVPRGDLLRCLQLLWSTSSHCLYFLYNFKIFMVFSS